MIYLEAAKTQGWTQTKQMILKSKHIASLDFCSIIIIINVITFVVIYRDHLTIVYSMHFKTVANIQVNFS